jgi:hypothetical protein
MKSPFPGMDPYIEACGLWEDFHSHLIEKLSEMLAAAVPEHYLVRSGERAYVVLAQPEGKDEYTFKADVGVASRSLPKAAAGEVALEEPATEGEPVTLRALIATEYRESFIEIFEADPERRLVTCLEVLSPSNKRRGSTGWEQYLRKRQGLLLGEANLVEIDLLRGGQRMPMVDPWPNSPYTLLVCRRERAPSCRVWPTHFQSRLPIIPVPLSRPDPDIPLDLQPIIEAIYQRWRYDRDIDYTRPLQPPLKPEQSMWLEQQLRARQSPAPEA